MTVNAAIRKRGYVVNRAARCLVTQRAGSVAFLLSESQDRFFADPNFTTLLRRQPSTATEDDPAPALDPRGVVVGA